MRRFIAYTMLATTMLVAVGVAASPVLAKMNAGREFTTGYEISFKVDALEEGQELPENAGQEVANEMSKRLAAFNFEDYSVKVQNGYNANNIDSQTVSVSFSCDQNVFNEVCKYLTFSGTNFLFTNTSEDGGAFEDHVQIDYENVYIEQYKERQPIVVIPLTKQGKTDLEDLIKKTEEAAPSHEDHASPRRSIMVNAHDEEGNPTPEEEAAANEQKQPDILLWGNYESGDNYSSALQNPTIFNKIVVGFNKDNIWYTTADGAENAFGEGKDKYHTAIKIMCGQLSESENPNKQLTEANIQATFFKSMLTASKYDYKITCPSVNITTSGGYDYITNALIVEPSNEYLISESKLAMNIVLVTTLIAIAVMAICLAVYYKVLSIGVIATTASTLLLSAFATCGMGILFNIPFLVGLIIIAACSLFAEIFYLTQFKEEVYKGRSLKKANQEASKKSNLITLDATIIVAFAGLMTYLLGGAALKPLGGVLFFGSIISLLMNLIVFKVLMYLVTNSMGLDSKLNLFGVNKDKVPNLMLEQKPTYVAPLEKVDFTKKSKLSGIILAALTGVSLFGILFFGIKDKTPLNIANATKDTTIVYTSLRDCEDTFENTDSFERIALKNIEEVNDKITSDVTSIDMKNVEVLPEDFDPSTVNETDKSLYFVTKISTKLSDDEITSLKEKIEANIVEEIGDANDKYSVEVYNVKELVYTPNQGLVALATGISIVGVAVYFMFRFRPSRGLSILVTTTAATTIAYGMMALTRAGTTAVASVAMPAVALIVMLMSLFYLYQEKAMFKENGNNLDFDQRKQIMKGALGKAALPSLVFLVFAAYISVNYFGFGLKSTVCLFVSMLIGVIVGAASLFMVAGPLAERFAKWFSRVNLPKLKLRKKQNTNLQKPKTSEPEETVFIGIND